MKKAIAIIIFAIIIVNIVGFTVFLKGNNQAPPSNNTNNSIVNVTNTTNSNFNNSNNSLQLLDNNKSNTNSNELR